MGSLGSVLETDSRFWGAKEGPICRLFVALTIGAIPDETICYLTAAYDYPYPAWDLYPGVQYVAFDTGGPRSGDVPHV
jgi:hypothetical protein